MSFFDGVLSFHISRLTQTYLLNTLCCNITPDYQIILTIIIYTNIYQDCIKQACVKCCNISTCQPHIQAKLEIQRKQSILDGTDPITIAANLKRLSKVKDNGSFMEGNIEGECPYCFICSIR